MRTLTKATTGALAAIAALSLAACGSEETATTDEGTAVTDVDPGEANGTIDDTTVIDGTMGAEEEMGMEDGMPEESSLPTRAVVPAEEDGNGEAEGTAGN